MLETIIRQLSPFPDYCAERVMSWHCDVDVDAANAIFFTVVAASAGLITLGVALRWKPISRHKKSNLRLSLIMIWMALAAIVPMLVFLHTLVSLPLSILVIIVLWRHMNRERQRLLQQK